MSDIVVALTGLWCFAFACFLFVWGVRKATLAVTRWAQAPKTLPVPCRTPDPRTQPDEGSIQRRREELAEAARVRYEATLRMLATAKLDQTELAAAGAKAKQDYLRELDRVMQGSTCCICVFCFF